MVRGNYKKTSAYFTRFMADEAILGQEEVESIIKKVGLPNPTPETKSTLSKGLEAALANLGFHQSRQNNPTQSQEEKRFRAVSACADKLLQSIEIAGLADNEFLELEKAFRNRERSKRRRRGPQDSYSPLKQSEARGNFVSAFVRRVERDRAFANWATVGRHIAQAPATDTMRIQRYETAIQEYLQAVHVLGVISNDCAKLHAKRKKRSRKGRSARHRGDPVTRDFVGALAGIYRKVWKRQAGISKSKSTSKPKKGEAPDGSASGSKLEPSGPFVRFVQEIYRTMNMQVPSGHNIGYALKKRTNRSKIKK